MKAARNLAFGAAAGVVVAYVLGQLSIDSPELALGLAAVPAFVALAIADAGLIVAAILPATYLTYRLGSSFDVSIADFALMCGVVVAFAGVTRSGRTLTGLLRCIAAYEIVLLISVWATPSPEAWIEWVHRAALMGGGILVGAAIVRYGKVTLAVRTFLAVTAVYSLAATYESLTTGLSPAYPLSVHKNAAGSLIAMAIALMLTAPTSGGVPTRYRRPLYFLLTFGLLATRSRGAIVGLGVVLLIWVLTQRGNSQRVRILAVMTAIAGGIFVWNSVQTELRSDVDKLGSIGTRERQHAQAWSAFELNTVSGVGLRYYDQRSELAPDGRPSSTVYEALAESGYLGTGALALIVVGPLLVLRRGRSEWMVAALAVYGLKAVHGVFDNFWVAGPFTMPWIIIGIAAAFEANDAAAADADEESDEATLIATTA